MTQAAQERTYTFGFGPLNFDVVATTRADAVMAARDAFAGGGDVPVLAPGPLSFARVNLSPDQIDEHNIVDVQPAEETGQENPQPAQVIDHTVKFRFTASVDELACSSEDETVDGLNDHLDGLLRQTAVGYGHSATDIDYRAVEVTPQGDVVVEASYVPDYADRNPYDAMLKQVERHEARGEGVPLRTSENVSIRDQLFCLAIEEVDREEEERVDALVALADAGTLSLDHLKGELGALAALLDGEQDAEDED